MVWAAHGALGLNYFAKLDAALQKDASNSIDLSMFEVWSFFCVSRYRILVYRDKVLITDHVRINLSQVQ